MENKQVENFLDAADELIGCKFLVAEYKIQKLLQALANADEIVSLIGECLEQFNRDREFAKAFIQDGSGDFVCNMPEEEYKIIALVFCTLIDIENKKIDFTDFVKRFFGKDGNAFDEFISRMIIPFRNLIAEAFGYKKIEEENANNNEFSQDEEKINYSNDEEADEEDDEGDLSEDAFLRAQKIAVQILSELEYSKTDKNANLATIICHSIIKTTSLRDSEITYSLAYALKTCKLKQVKFLVKEMCDILDV